MGEAIAGAIASIVVGALAYFGVRHQTHAAKAGSDAQKHVGESQQVLDAWKELIAPMREENVELRRRVGDLEDRATASDTRLDQAVKELHRWQQVARTLARWGVSMRDQLKALGHDVPAEPDELITLRIVSDARDEDIEP